MSQLRRDERCRKSAATVPQNTVFYWDYDASVHLVRMHLGGISSRRHLTYSHHYEVRIRPQCRNLVTHPHDELSKEHLSVFDGRGIICPRGGNVCHRAYLNQAMFRDGLTRSLQSCPLHEYS